MLLAPPPPPPQRTSRGAWGPPARWPGAWPGPQWASCAWVVCCRQSASPLQLSVLSEQRCGAGCGRGAPCVTTACWCALGRRGRGAARRPGSRSGPGSAGRGPGWPGWVAASPAEGAGGVSCCKPLIFLATCRVMGPWQGSQPALWLIVLSYPHVHINPSVCVFHSSPSQPISCHSRHPSQSSPAAPGLAS